MDYDWEKIEKNEPGVLISKPLESVEINSVTILKIIKDLKGDLYGIDSNGKLQISNAWPVCEDDSISKQLQSLNYDGNKVGCTSSFDSILIDHLKSLQNKNPLSVVVLFDAFKLSQNVLSLMCVQLDDDYLKGNVFKQDIFKKLPIKIVDSSLAEAMFSHISLDMDLTPQLPANIFIERQLENLQDLIEEHCHELQKWQTWQKSHQKENLKRLQNLERMKEENAQAVKMGNEPVYSEFQLEELPQNLARIINEEPNPADTNIIYHRIEDYSQQLEAFVAK